ncbi:MAG: bifunctional deaminase-reductase domain protein [Bacteroidota bacterium]|nr:bifunctional deaminase-reductase domain protein [Bacteroidota bacterium]
MGNVIFAINISLDGCCDHTKFGGGPDEELYGYYTQLVRDTDVFAYGRITYQLMVPYWPDLAKNPSEDKAENEYAKAFDAVNKIVVFSKTLKSAEGKNTEIVSTHLPDTILKLKQEPGKNILIGGVNIAAQLTALGLIDEYQFVVHPIIAGEGRRLLDGISLPPLKLVELRSFKSGCVALRYVKG